jgi:hypothetical protein
VKRIAVVALIGLCSFTLAAPPTPAEIAAAQAAAFAEGSDAGATAATAAIRSNVTAATGASVVSDYGAPVAGQSAYWGGGAGLLGTMTTGGVGQVTGCDDGTAVTDVKSGQHCEAVNALAKQGTTTPFVINKTDPDYVSSRAIMANPEAVAGSIETAYTACTTTTETSKPDKTTETCDDYSSTEGANCSSGVEVTVDPDHLYKCLDSVNVTAAAQCTVGRVIVVDADANYQCVDTQEVHSILTCDKVTNVAVTPGPWPGGLNQTISGSLAGRKFGATNEMPRINATYLSNNPAGGTATVSSSNYTRRGYNQSIVFSVYNPAGGLIGSNTCAQAYLCTQTVPGKSSQCIAPCSYTFPATATGTYRVYVTITQPSYGWSNSWNLYGYIDQAQLPATITPTVDNQCAALEARAL